MHNCWGCIAKGVWSDLFWAVFHGAQNLFYLILTVLYNAVKKQADTNVIVLLNGKLAPNVELEIQGLHL